MNCKFQTLQNKDVEVSAKSINIIYFAISNFLTKKNHVLFLQIIWKNKKKCTRCCTYDESNFMIKSIKRVRDKKFVEQTLQRTRKFDRVKTRSSLTIIWKASWCINAVSFDDDDAAAALDFVLATTATVQLNLQLKLATWLLSNRYSVREWI